MAAPPSIALFTCRLLHAGIGDQLSQLQTLYALGRHLGLTYVHSPLSTRWCPGLDINSFLGLPEGEMTLTDFPSHRFIDTPYSVILDCFRRNMRPPVLLDSLHSSPTTIHRFISTPEIYADKPEFTDSRPPSRLDLAKKFRSAHRSSNLATPFHSDLVKVAIHLRRGDCTWYKNGEEYYFPFQGKCGSRDAMRVNLRRAPSLSYIDDILRRLTDEHGAHNLEIRLYSDGFGLPIIGPLRGRELIKHVLSLLLSRSRFRTHSLPPVCALCWEVQKRVTQERRAFRTYFEPRHDITLRVGRSAALTRETIYAFALADIVVLGRKNAFPDLGLGLNSSQRRITPDDFSSANIEAKFPVLQR